MVAIIGGAVVGAGQSLPAEALDEELIASGAILYLEGYLWDPEEPRKAMRRAIEGLSVPPELALIDGNRCPVCAVRTEAIVKGDDKVAEISAASILAKTARDAALMTMHALYPQYAFDQHKGYPTALHLERLRLHGVTPEHRRSYAPVRAALAGAPV